MSAQDAVAATRASLSALDAAVTRLRDEFGETLGVRRLTSDVGRLLADLDELGDPMPGHRPGAQSGEPIEVSDEPYDETMWQAAESEAQRPM